MTPPAPLASRPHDAPRSVRYWLGALRDRWWVVALVGLLVLSWRGYVAMTQTPVYLSQASLRFEAPQEAQTGLASMWMSDSLDTILASETFALRSARVAERAARLYPEQVTVAQVHSWRPFEVTLVDLGWAPPPCVIVATSPPGTEWRQSRRVRLDFEGPEGAPRLWHPGAPAPTVFGQRRADGAFVVSLDGNEITLRIVSCSPKGKQFELVVRTPAELAAWLRAGSNPHSAGSGTGVLYVGFTAGTPDEARMGAQALVDAYKSLRDEDTREASQTRAEWLKGQAASLAKKAEEAEQRFDEYVAQTGALLLGEQAQGMIQDLGRLLSERLTQEHLLTGEREVLAELEAAKEPERVLVLLGAAGADSMISAWTERVADLEAQRGALLRTEGTADHPQVKRLDAEIEEGQKQLAAHLGTARERALELQRRKISRLEAHIQGLKDERERVEARLKALPAEQRATERLQREVRLIAETYEQILRWQKETELQGVAERAPLSIVDRAETPESRLAPVLSRSLAVAVLLALVLGVLVALLLHWRDRTIRMPADLEEATGLSLFGAIPAYGSVPRSERRGLKGSLPAADVPDSVLSEAYRALRANLRFAGVDRPVQALAITSAAPKEGKSTTTLNLAIVMAQAGQRVVVVDADLRRPNAHAYLDARLEPGLVQVLVDATPWSQVVQKGLHGVDLISAGGRPPNPGALLESKRLGALLQELRAAYDQILFDVPPILAAVDASSIFSQLDGVLLLSRRGRVTAEMADAARDRIQRVGGRVLGSVFNALDARKGAKRYGYRYGYTERYGERPAAARSTRPPAPKEPPKGA